MCLLAVHLLQCQSSLCLHPGNGLLEDLNFQTTEGEKIKRFFYLKKIIIYIKLNIMN